VRQLPAKRFIPMPSTWAALVFAAAMLAGGAGPAGAADSFAPLLTGASNQEASIQRELLIKRIDRLKRTGKPADAARLMPMLKDPDQLVRRQAEQAIWLLWGRSGNPAADQLFRAGVVQIGRDEIDQAIDTFTRVLDNLPTFAEAWNKRAAARFIAGDLAGAMDDCERALALVPDHFGSLAGYGHIYFRLDDLDMAIRYWQRALAVNPNLQSVERSIEAAGKILAGRGRLST
jgi:tetratricopeptide (TPR) repeat protein